MKFDCSTDQLLQNLNVVQRGVAVRSTILALQGIKFFAVDNSLILTGTNSEIGIQAIIPANVSEEGELVLGANFILDIIRRLSGETVYFETTSDTNLKVDSQLSEFNINYLTTEEYPPFPHIDEEYELEMDSETFKHLIHSVSFSVAVAEHIPILLGIKMEIKGDQITLVALDGYRLAVNKGKLDEPIRDDVSVVVPGKSMMELDKMLSGRSGKINIRFSRTQIFFEFDTILFVSRLMEGEFLNHDRIIPKEKTTEVILERRLLLESCERAALMSREGKSNLIGLEFDIDKLKISGSGDVGAVNDIMPVEKKGANLTISFNPKFLLEALRAIHDNKIRMEFTTSVSPGVIYSLDEKKEYTYLILPVRVA